MKTNRIVFEISGRQFSCISGEQIVMQRFSHLELQKEYTAKGILSIDSESKQLQKDFSVKVIPEKFFLGPKVLFFRKHRRNSRYKRKGHRAKLALVTIHKND